MVPIKDKKIFVLDSSRFITGAIKAQLEPRGAQVEEAAHSEAALMRIIRWHPDLLITGIEVGVLKGFDLCLLLRLMPDYAGIPIVVISSGEQDVTSRRVADAGGDFYVHKDDQLLSNVEAILDQVFYQNVRKPEAVADRRLVERVLVTDDSGIMRRIIRNILNSLGIATVLEAEDGVHGLALLQEHPVDLILTDWNMPKMNGLDFIKRIRAQPALSAVPIVMITTESGQGEVEEARAAGANGHLCKPFNGESMRAMIARFADNCVR